jgi:hypothetical protein
MMKFILACHIKSFSLLLFWLFWLFFFHSFANLPFLSLWFFLNLVVLNFYIIHNLNTRLDRLIIGYFLLILLILATLFNIIAFDIFFSIGLFVLLIVLSHLLLPILLVLLLLSIGLIILYEGLGTSQTL